MLDKTLIDLRGHQRSEAALAVQAHAGAAGVMPKPNRMDRAAIGDRAAGA